MTNIPDGLPKDGKLIVVSPTNAAKMAERVPEHANRIFTFPEIENNVGYVVDIDKINELLNAPNDNPFKFSTHLDPFQF